MFMAAIKLRYSKPDVLRPYHIPFKKVGIWVVGCMGIVASLFAIILCFVPPSTLKVGNPVSYALLLGVGLFIMCIIPLGIHAKRKPNWILK
jgi:hypothetical protein